MEIEIINTGNFLADGGAMFGRLPKSIWGKKYPTDKYNRCTMAMNIALVQDKDHKILIDTGVGNKQLQALRGYHFSKLQNIQQILATYHLTPADITDVVLTHLHLDHCGGCTELDHTTGEIKVTFPHATYHLTRKQWQQSLQAKGIDYDAYFAENMELLQQENRIHYIEDEPWSPCKGFFAKSYDGHTPGQLVCAIDTPQQKYLFAGDTIPLALSHHFPLSISAYDLNANESYLAKKEIIQWATDENREIIYCHETNMYP